MGAIVRSLLVGAGAISAAATAGLAYWVDGKTKELPADQRGNLLLRMQGVMAAYQQSKKIEDPYTAELHLDLATSLSSREFTVTSDRSEKETDAVKTSYYAGYIPEALRRNPGMAPPIFRYDNNLPVILPHLLGSAQIHKGFVFAGLAPQIHDTQARASILHGVYVRCKDELEIAKPAAKKIDVIITGTTEESKCSQFKNAFLRDVAWLSADDIRPLDPSHPYSDTPVFDCSEKGCEKTGDLANMPETTKRKISIENFTACNFHALVKTRLSGGRYKEVGAIVAGTENDNVCSDLHFAHMRELIAANKRQKG